ncbi:MAG: YcbK family protein, partial [Chthoniobacterales bacterium]
KAVIAPHLKTRGRLANSLPPKDCWKNIAPTLRAVDRLSTVLQEPVVEVISAYRSPAYNRSCGGSGASQHVRNTALDLKFESSPRTVAKAARELRDRGVFLGGVGRYSGFTHIDTRGSKADW